MVRECFPGAFGRGVSFLALLILVVSSNVGRAQETVAGNSPEEISGLASNPADSDTSTLAVPADSGPAPSCRHS